MSLSMSLEMVGALAALIVPLYVMNYKLSRDIGEVKESVGENRGRLNTLPDGGRRENND